LYVFRLSATNIQGQIAIRTLELFCGPPPVPLWLSTRLLETNKLAALTVHGPSGKKCVVLISTNLLDWWTLYSVGIPNGTGEVNESTAQYPRRFYRLRIDDP
jgi:hypothetical protein